MGYIDQSPLVNLRMTFADPPGKALLIQSRFPLQGRADCVNDKVQEVRFIATITVWTGEDNPIGSAGFYERGASGSGLIKKVTTGAAVPGGLTANNAAVHCFMI